jgi:Leucine-rich repeat (LRR) protein
MNVLKVDKKNLYILSSLPSNLEVLYCGYNRLSHLPYLPETLRELNCPHNRLTLLPDLPALTILDITTNHIEHLQLPETLVKLYCSFNPYLKIITFPNTLRVLHCCNNHIDILCLPPQIEIVYCSYNEIKHIVLPPGIKEFYGDHNLLTSLVLPETLEMLDCDDNRLTALTLPPNLRGLNVSHNQLTSIVFNKRLIRVNLSNNPLQRVPVLHNGFTFLNLNHTHVESCFTFYDPVKQYGGLYLYGTPLYTKMKAVLHVERILDPCMIQLSFDMITMIEDKFKENYYGLKIKTRMLSWMWQARETLARRKYHPDELWKRLDQGFDALEQWD